MLALFITPPVLSPGWTHDATDWQVAEDPDFKNIVKESLGDTKNKLVKIFDDSDLDYSKSYYARARVVFNKGLSEWSNVDIVKFEDLDPIKVTLDLPTLLATPEIKLNFDPNNVPGGLFTISTTPLNASTNVKHIVTNWIIEDSNNNVVWSSLNDGENLTDIFVSYPILKEGETYFIKVSHVASSNDVSPLGILTFTVPKIPEIEVLSNLTDIPGDEDLVVKLSPIENLKTLEWRFYAAGLNTISLLANDSTDTTTFIIDNKNFTNPLRTYILELIAELDDGTKLGPKYYPVTVQQTTYNDIENTAES